MGEWGGASGSEYIRPRVGGKVEKVVSKVVVEESHIHYMEADFQLSPH